MAGTAAARVRISVPEGVLFQEVNDQAALLDLATETYFGLDDVGARMWQALEKTGTIEGAVEELSAVYAVDAERLAGDVRGLVEQLRGHGLVVVEDA
jgi:hypothetical protein